MGDAAKRCEICGVERDDHGLPHWYCWDHRATPDEVRLLVEQVRVDSTASAGRLLSAIGSPEAAPALREYLLDADLRVLRAVVSSLGWSGDASDATELLRLATHEDAAVAESAIASLAELGIRDAIGPLGELRDREGPGRARSLLLRARAWLGDPAVADELRERLEADGPHGRLGTGTVADSLALVGTADDRARMAELAVATLERAAAEGYVSPSYERAKAWNAYESAVAPVEGEEVQAVRDSLSPEARLALTHHPYRGPSLNEIENGHGPRCVPRRSMRYVDEEPAPGGRTLSKFGGQPIWWAEPCWPLGPDGEPLIFYGQIEVGEGRVVYLFVGPPVSWIGEPHSDWTAVVVQPGAFVGPHSVQATGPVLYEWTREPRRFRKRARRAPLPPRYVVWEDGFDPAQYRPGGALDRDDSNKVGGTPWWLQGSRDLGPGWSWSFQFDAGLAATDFSDGAVVYGFLHDDGRGTLMSDSH